MNGCIFLPQALTPTFLLHPGESWNLGHCSSRDPFLILGERAKFLVTRKSRSGRKLSRFVCKLSSGRPARGRTEPASRRQQVGTYLQVLSPLLISLTPISHFSSDPQAQLSERGLISSLFSSRKVIGLFYFPKASGRF